MAKRPKRTKGPVPRNPFAIVARRRKAGPEKSPRAYRRRPKHRIKVVEPEPAES